MRHLAQQLAAVVLALVATLVVRSQEAQGQRVEFPSTVPGGLSYPTAPSYAPATSLPAFDPYAPGGLAAPAAPIAPYAAPAAPYAPQLTAPPVMTPYAAQPGGLGVAPQPSGGWFSNVGWEPGQYVYQNPNGSSARLQRFLQEISVEHTFLGGQTGSPTELQINRTELTATFGVPIFSNPDTPLLITPGFAFNWLQGPSGGAADLPARVYDAYLDAAWAPRFSERFSADLGVRTGVWTDFNVVNADSIRILGRGLGVFALSPRMDILAGVWYIDRNHIKLLPAGGVHWRPSDEWDMYLVFPNPKIRKRFLPASQIEWWWYVAGEYGGGRWSIERDDGREDNFDYNDIRIIGGVEWETQTQLHAYVEGGFVFNRELRYVKTLDPAILNLDQTVMVRAGIDF